MLDILLAFVDKVIPGQRFVVVGASYGGLLARGVVYRRSAAIDGLLLLVPVLKADARERTLPARVTLVEDLALVSELEADEAKGFVEIAVVQSRKLAEVLRTLSPAVQIADYEFLSRLYSNLDFSFDVDKLPEPFVGPSLFLTGRQDHWCGYQDAWSILENYPRATFAVLDRAGHALTVEQEGLVNALRAEWLDRIEANVKS